MRAGQPDLLLVAITIYDHGPKAAHLGSAKLTLHPSPTLLSTFCVLG